MSVVATVFVADARERSGVCMGVCVYGEVRIHTRGQTDRTLSQMPHCVFFSVDNILTRQLWRLWAEQLKWSCEC